MTWWNLLGIAVSLVWFWLALRTYRLGRVPGTDQPNRADRPGQFWFVLLLFVSGGLYFLVSNLTNLMD